MDLCVSCKACKKECPSAVDMALIKTEYLAQRNEAHGAFLRQGCSAVCRSGLDAGGVPLRWLALARNALPPVAWVGREVFGPYLAPSPAAAVGAPLLCARARPDRANA